MRLNGFVGRAAARLAAQPKPPIWPLATTRFIRCRRRRRRRRHVHRRPRSLIIKVTPNSSASASREAPREAEVGCQPQANETGAAGQGSVLLRWGGFGSFWWDWRLP